LLAEKKLLEEKHNLRAKKRTERQEGDLERERKGVTAVINKRQQWP
jgi:hypothetical protein